MNSDDRRLLVGAMFVDTVGGGLLTPFELVYALKIAHLSLASAGIVLSVASAVGIAVGPLAGAAVDRVGPTRVVRRTTFWARCWTPCGFPPPAAWSGQRRPTGAKVTQSVQIGRPHSEHDNPVSRSGWR